jgi:ribosomal protein S18 acetylase RimI-like enzyme
MIVYATSDQDFATARELFSEYADSLDFDLDFQDFRKELAELPGEYAGPRGCILIALENGSAAGCVALRKLREIGNDIAEMKRLYVRPQFRRTGLGKLLAQRIVEEARQRGYKRMFLDTVPSMEPAIMLYRSLGFRPIAPYRYNPIEGALFMELDLYPQPKLSSR